ncbi:MAG: hypothetical protein ACI9NI_001724 [Olleya marilimosa]|jgi:hypothetical protein|uniref:hypothetical protein n=1 Tax=Olleya marilimosa TaxID=272164 RepID=UPI0030EC00FA|tara:strand:+ start:55154 stop:55729 length:576 start_codon:yes stop_codon:yes gene_type:complete
MKTLITLILTLSIFSKAEAKKIFLPYEIIIGSADLVVEGEIISVSNGFYKFKVAEFIKNNSEKIITVEMFPEWTCDQRIIPAEKGQKLLLFLTKSNEEFYQIINGSTGELFIENVLGDFYQDFEFENYDDIKKGIKLFVKSFDYCGELYPKFNEKQTFKKLLTETELSKLELESKFFKSIRKKLTKEYHLV